MGQKENKMQAELAKNKEKIIALQQRNKELERQLTEVINTEIIGLVRSSKMTLAELKKYLESQDRKKATHTKALSEPNTASDYEEGDEG